jgi:hypothetical protein
VLESIGSASVWVRVLDVDNKDACPDEGEEDLLGLVARVDIAMDQSRRNVEKPTRFHVRTFAPARPELEAGATANHMAEHISIAVVVPAGRGAALRACTHEDRTGRVEGNLTDESRRRRSRCKAVGANRPYAEMSTLRSHAARLQRADALSGQASYASPVRATGIEIRAPTGGPWPLSAVAWASVRE